MMVIQSGNVERLSQNYMRMNETGKEKMIKVAEQFLTIWNCVDKGTVIPDENKGITECANKMCGTRQI